MTHVTASCAPLHSRQAALQRACGTRQDGVSIPRLSNARTGRPHRSSQARRAETKRATPAASASPPTIGGRGSDFVLS